MAVAALSKWRLRQKLCIEEAFKVHSFSFKLITRCTSVLVFFRFDHPYLSLLYFSGVLQSHDFILVLSFGKPSLVLQIISCSFSKTIFSSTNYLKYQARLPKG